MKTKHKKTNVRKNKSIRTTKKTNVRKKIDYRKTFKSILKKMKKSKTAGLVNDFLVAHIDPVLKQDINQIGKGATGTVYVYNKYNDSVFKISNSSETCSHWTKESEIYKILNTFNIDEELCKILKMKDYMINDLLCGMELTRCYNPLGLEYHYTIHPLFQYYDYYKEIDGRGHYLGIKQLIENNILKNELIPEYVRQLSIVMAKLHYFVKNDGFDLEIFVSKKGETTELYIADFDLSNFYTEITPEIIDRIVWSLESVEYFPIEGHLYDIFSENYLNEAEKYDMRDIAEEILANYVSI
jgi:hypothetical protein